VRECGQSGPRGPCGHVACEEMTANAVLVLPAMACALLNRQIAAQTATFDLAYRQTTPPPG